VSWKVTRYSLESGMMETTEVGLWEHKTTTSSNLDIKPWKDTA
jgi:hypothetical protein